MNITYIDTLTFERMLSKVELLSYRFSKLAPSPRSKELENWLDSQDACAIMRISPRTLQSLRSIGRLSYSHIGGKMYYNKDEITKLIGNKQGGKQLSLNFKE